MTDAEKNQIKHENPIFLGLAKDGKTYICPRCGSGTGKNGTGMMRHIAKNNPRWKCFSCNLYGDVFDLFQIKFDISDQREMFDACLKYFNENGFTANLEERITEYKRMELQEEEYKSAPMDFTKFYEMAEKNNDFKYLEARGISKEIQKKFHIGFVEKWQNPKTLANAENPRKVPYSPRCIIPRSKSNYLARDTSTNNKYSKITAGAHTCLFNEEALNHKIVFITEGEIDAMSVEEVGGNACSINSVKNWILAVDYLNKHRKGQIVILLLDNDEEGIKTSETMAEELNKLHILNIVFSLGKYGVKDANQLLLTDREAMKEMVMELIEDAMMIAKNNSIKDDITSEIKYFEKIEILSEYKTAKTGFLLLDKKGDDGWLKNGLYIIGGEPCIGKTSFALQMAEQMARDENDVVFFSYELPVRELIARGLSRRTLEIVNRKNHDIDYAKTVTDFLSGERQHHFSNNEKALMSKAIEHYTSENKNHLYIYENEKDGILTFEKIKEIIDKYKNVKNKNPFIFIDNLDALGCESDMGFKQTAYRLRNLARKLGLTIIATCGTSNAGKLSELTSNSDVMILLKESKVGKDKVETDNYSDGISIDLSCVKDIDNKPFVLNMTFYPCFNYFKFSDI